MDVAAYINVHKPRWCLDLIVHSNQIFIFNISVSHGNQVQVDVNNFIITYTGYIMKLPYLGKTGNILRYPFAVRFI